MWISSINGGFEWENNLFMNVSMWKSPNFFLDFPASHATGWLLHAHKSAGSKKEQPYWTRSIHTNKIMKIDKESESIRNNYGFFVWNLPLKIPTPFWGRQNQCWFSRPKHQIPDIFPYFFHGFQDLFHVFHTFSRCFSMVSTRHRGAANVHQDPAMGENREALWGEPWGRGVEWDVGLSLYHYQWDYIM